MASSCASIRTDPARRRWRLPAESPAGRGALSRAAGRLVLAALLAATISGSLTAPARGQEDGSPPPRSPSGRVPGTSLPAPVLTNGAATMVFRMDGNGRDLWPVSLASRAAGQTIRFANEARGTAVFELELRQSGDLATRVLVHPTDLGAPALTLAPFAPGARSWDPRPGRRLTARWTGSLPPPSGPGTIDVQVELEWILFRASDTVEARVSDARVLNDTATTYRIWLVRFPRVEIASLAAGGGQDFLATGRFGGFLYERPIDYVDPATQSPYVFTKFPGNDADPGNTWPISIDSTEPGILALPVSLYGDAASGAGLYQATDDSRATLKGLYFVPHPDGTDPSRAALFSETVQYPEGDAFDVRSYTSPYRAHLATIQGDWVDAALRYRKVYRGFRWYPGPTGSVQNLDFPPGMRAEPIYAFLNSGNGYEPWTYNLRQTFEHAQFWATWFGTTFPFLVFNRFGVDPPAEITLLGYTPDPNLGMVQRVATAEQAGHKVAIHGLTEKLTVTSGGLICQMFPGYCQRMDSTILSMNQENAIALSVGSAAIGSPCPRGKGQTEPDWPGWFAGINASVANTLGATGGQGWPAPTVAAGWDFRNVHDHDASGGTPPGKDPPGFGSWYAQGWIQMAQAVQSQVNLPNPGDPFPTLIELSGATLAPGAPLQNDVAFDISADLNHTNPSPLDLTPWFDAPIRSIPMLAMVADNLRLVSTYGPKTTALPYTPYHSLPPGGSQPPDAIQYFKDFPAVSGALSCWSMAERVLARQGTLILNDELHVPTADVTSNDPNLAFHQKAAQDLFRFYQGLHAFLTATNLQAAPLMAYATGTLERSPAVILTDATEHWVLSAATISQFFPQLATAMSSQVWNYPAADLDWSRYRPGNAQLGLTFTYGHIWFPSTPLEGQSWLPHGMFRDAGGTKLAMFLANPWGVQHADGQGLSKPMNPFTFDYADPTQSPANTYGYQFSFDPADYEGFPSSYQYWREGFDVTGSRVVQTTPQPANGPVTLTGSLPPFQFAAWFFQ